jgi:hypothetical protein
MSWELFLDVSVGFAVLKFDMQIFCISRHLWTRVYEMEQMNVLSLKKISEVNSNVPVFFI